MDHFNLKNGELHAEDVALAAIAEAHIAGRSDHSRLLWQLLMLDRSLAGLGLA